MLIILDATLTVRTELSIGYTVYMSIFVIFTVNNCVLCFRRRK